MSIPDAISRLTDYYSRHGFVATVHRALVAAKRALFYNRMVLFYYDLADGISDTSVFPSAIKVERVGNAARLNSDDLQELTSFWNPKQVCRNIQERFRRGASIWLVKVDDRLAGYGWTLRGDTIEPHYFPLGQDDVHLFDFHVLPEFRGRGLNPLLVTHILSTVATESGGRAFIEAAEWNQAQLASLRKTPFRRLGLARLLTVFGHTLTSWSEKDAAGGPHEGLPGDNVLTIAKPHER